MRAKAKSINSNAKDDGSYLVVDGNLLPRHKVIKVMIASPAPDDAYRCFSNINFSIFNIPRCAISRWAIKHLDRDYASSFNVFFAFPAAVS